MAGFKFLHLPPNVQKKVLDSVHVGNLMLFAHASSRAKTIAKDQQLSFKSALCAFNFKRDKEMELKLFNRADKCVLCCLMKRIQNDDRPGNDYTYDITWTGRLTEENRMVNFRSVVEHVFDIFVIEEFHVSMDEPFNLRDSFVWDLATAPTHLRLRKTGNQPIPISADNCKFALEELSIGYLSISGDVDPGYTCSTPLRSRTVILHTAHWLKLEAILGMTTKHLALYDSDDSLSNREIHKILDVWKNGGLKTLKTLTMHSNAPAELAIDRKMKLKSYLRGLETFPWDKENRPAKHTSLGKTVDLSKANDFRSNDGRLASMDFLQEIGLHIVFWSRKRRANF